MQKVSAACSIEWSIKLEKALRSKNPDRVVEAILETGVKLEQWSKEPPESAVVAVYNLFGLIPEEDRLFSNSILLRLVDAFCFGNKLVIKLAVVRVFMSMLKLSRGKNKSSECATWFLSKARVHNHLEILKRVKNVHDKGDTESKALALVLFGCLRDFACEFAPVRYLIFTSMVSSHDLEVRSSLFAAACFCEVADDFALVVLGMLNDMVKFPEIMPKTRLAAVRVFAKMGCSDAIANRTFKICMKLMLESPKEDSLVPFLVSMTKLASRSTHLASELAEIIMPYLGEDKTSHVRTAVIRCLHFLIKRGMCFSLVHDRETEHFSSLLKQAELSRDMQLKALEIFQKILVYKLCVADGSELHQLIAILENAASHFQISSGSCIAISILVDIWKQIVRTAEMRSIEVSCTSLQLQLIELIMNRLGKLCSDHPLQVDSDLVGEVKELFNSILLLVEKHSEMRLLVLDKVRLFLEYIVNLTDGLRKTDGAHELLLGVINYKGDKGVVVRSEFLASIHKFLIVFLENLEGDGFLLSQAYYDKVKHITECVRSCSFFDFHTQMMFTLLLHSPILWGNSGVSLVADISNYYTIISLDCSKQILVERNYWPAYRAGVYAARLGAWATSALVFDQLKTNVQSDINCSWLKSLSYLSHAEGKFQLLFTPQSSSSYLPEFSRDASGDYSHCLALYEANMNLQSSLGMLGNTKAASREEVLFCFQMWFLVLKSRVLETLIDLIEHLGLLNQDICNKKKQILNLRCNSLLQQLPQISIQLQNLAKEFDVLATCFIDIDESSSSIIATFSLSCSVLAFAAGIVLFLPGFSFHEEALVPFTSQSALCSRLVQNLVRQLWKVDPDICEKLNNILVKENESVNWSSDLRNQVLRISSKVKILLSICRDVLSCIYGLQKNQSSSSVREEEEIIKSFKKLLSQAILKWIQIPFGIPKYFFHTRPCVGAELFALSSDSSKRSTTDTISVEQGFQLSLDLCLQLKNIQQQSKVPLRLTKMYCLLYSKLAYHTSSETNKNQKSPWKDEDLVEMSDKLFHHAATKSAGKKMPKVSGRFDSNNNNGVSSTIVQFEPNERGQGFSSCLLDVARLPVGSYQIKWLSCCIDQHGSYWNLLPLNGKPVFTVMTKCHKSYKDPRMI